VFVWSPPVDAGGSVGAAGGSLAGGIAGAPVSAESFIPLAGIAGAAESPAGAADASLVVLVKLLI
jgi:hypothetical protein